jgi:F0F1-type ATP synthase alpha subunit
VGLISWSVDRAEAVVEAAQGDLVDIEGSGPALVTALLRDRLVLATLSARRPAANAVVRRRGPLVTAVDDGQIGKTVDCLGEVIDASPHRGSAYAPIFARDPVVVTASRPRLTLGTLVFDLKSVVDVGTAILATGPRRALDHILQHQVAADRIVILATPHATAPEHCALRRGNVRCIHVAAPRDATPAQLWLVPWTAVAIGDALRKQGKHVVVALDDLDAWRPYVRRFPDRGSWSTQLAALASRAYASTGSVSLIALTRELDVTSAAAFDTAIDLRAMIRGEPLASSSKIVHPPIRLHGKGKLGGAYVTAMQLAELEAFADMHARLDRSTMQRLEDGRRIREVFRLREGASVDSLEQILSLLAVLHVRDLPSHAVGGFVDAFVARLREQPELAAVRRARVLGVEDEQRFMALALEVAVRMDDVP